MCIGLDSDISQVPQDLPSDNIRVSKQNFEEFKLARKADLIWSHDSFRYCINPLSTLKLWNENINENGMLVIVVPQTINLVNRRPVVRTLPTNYFHYSITNMIYMLAVNGFDCKGGHFNKSPDDPWLHCVAYKSEHPPMDPRTTTWYDLAEKQLLPDTADACISRYGYLKQEELQTHWLNREFCNWNRV